MYRVVREFSLPYVGHVGPGDEIDMEPERAERLVLEGYIKEIGMVDAVKQLVKKQRGGAQR